MQDYSYLSIYTIIIEDYYYYFYKVYYVTLTITMRLTHVLYIYCYDQDSNQRTYIRYYLLQILRYLPLGYWGIY